MHTQTTFVVDVHLAVGQAIPSGNPETYVYEVCFVIIIGHCATSQKVAGSIPDGVIRFFE